MLNVTGSSLGSYYCVTALQCQPLHLGLLLSANMCSYLAENIERGVLAAIQSFSNASAATASNRELCKLFFLTRVAMFTCI